MAIASSIIAASIAAAAASGSAIASAKSQSGAARRAGDIQAQTSTAALDYEREQDRIEREQYAQEYARKIELEEERRKYEAEDRLRLQSERDRLAALDAERLKLERERFGVDSELGRERLGLDRNQQNWTFQQRADLLERMAPYRQFGEAGLKKLTGLL